MSENELLSIVHKIELVFHAAQFQKQYHAVKLPSDSAEILNLDSGREHKHFGDNQVE